MDEKIARLSALRYVNDVLEANTKNWILDNGGRELSGTDFTHIMGEVRAIVTDLRRERLAMLEDMLDAGYTLMPPAPLSVETMIIERTIENWTPSPADMPVIIENPEPVQEAAPESEATKDKSGVVRMNYTLYGDERIKVMGNKWTMLALYNRTDDEETKRHLEQRLAKLQLKPALDDTGRYVLKSLDWTPEEVKPSTLRWRLVREYNAGATADRRAEIEAVLREKAGLRIVYDTTRTRFEATPVDKPLGAGRVEKADAPGAPEFVQEETEEINGVEILSTNRFQLIDAFNQAQTNLVARNAIVKALKKLGFKPVKKSEDSKEYVLAEIDRDTPAPPSVLNNLRPDFIERRAYTG